MLNDLLQKLADYQYKQNKLSIISIAGNWKLASGSFLFHGWIYAIIHTVPTSSAVYGWLVSDFVIIFYFVQKGGGQTFRHIGDKWVGRLMASVVLHVLTDIHFTSQSLVHNCLVAQCFVHTALCTLNVLYQLLVPFPFLIPVHKI